MDNKQQRLNFGYLVTGSTAAVTTGGLTMNSVTLGYSSFQTASTAASVTGRTLAAGKTLLAVIAKHSTSFAGAGISAVRLDLGIASDPTKFLNAFDIYQGVADTAQDSALVLYYPVVDTIIQVRVTAVGANLSALTAGSVTIYFQEINNT